MKRDLIIGYTGQLKQYGYLEDHLAPEMGMIVNTNIFHPRELTDEQKEKYGCDVMFASNRGKPTERIVEEDLLPALSPKGFTRETLFEIHDFLWQEYRAEKTFTNENLLQDALYQIDSFRLPFQALSQDDQNNTIQILFWQLNDTIYRFIVLEWLVEYAEECESMKVRKCESVGEECESAKVRKCESEEKERSSHSSNIHTKPFRLHLYGNQWHEHPKFSKYDKGPIPHDQNLSIAYQAAKYCLHLNTYEGRHQRLFEIVASAGTPITRCINKTNLIDPDLASAFRKTADTLLGNTNTSPNLSVLEETALIDHIFSLSHACLNEKPNLNIEELGTEVEKRLKQRLTNWCDWFFETWSQFNFQSQDDLVKIMIDLKVAKDAPTTTHMAPPLITSTLSPPSIKQRHLIRLGESLYLTTLNIRGMVLDSFNVKKKQEIPFFKKLHTAQVICELAFIIHNIQAQPTQILQKSNSIPMVDLFNQINHPSDSIKLIVSDALIKMNKKKEAKQILKSIIPKRLNSIPLETHYWILLSTYDKTRHPEYSIANLIHTIKNKDITLLNNTITLLNILPPKRSTFCLKSIKSEKLPDFLKLPFIFACLGAGFLHKVKAELSQLDDINLYCLEEIDSRKLVWLLIKFSFFDKALIIIDSAEKHLKKKNTFLLEKAVIQKCLLQYDKAFDSLNLHKKLNGNTIRNTQWLSLFKFYNGEFEESISLANSFAKEPGTNASFQSLSYFIIALCWRNLGDFQRAIEYHKKSFSNTRIKKFPFMKIELSRLLEFLGEHREAKEILEFTKNVDRKSDKLFQIFYDIISIRHNEIPPESVNCSKLLNISRTFTEPWLHYDILHTLWIASASEALGNNAQTTAIIKSLLTQCHICKDQKPVLSVKSGGVFMLDDSVLKVIINRMFPFHRSSSFERTLVEAEIKSIPSKAICG